MNHPSRLRPYPYIGITGFMSADEVHSLQVCLAQQNYNPMIMRRQLMCGILADWKTLSGQKPSQPGRYPPTEKIKAICAHKAPNLIYLIHYSSHQADLNRQLTQLAQKAEYQNHGFQLNIPWPEWRDLEDWRVKHPNQRLVIQVSHKSLDRLKKLNVSTLVNALSVYQNSMTDILFDMSGGSGEPLDLELAHDMLSGLYEFFGDEYGVGVAGGLDAKTVLDLQRHLKKFPDLSLDAESRLRDEQDALDISKAHRYFLRALEMIPR